MADDPKTLADLVKVNDKNLADIEVSDILNDSPLFQRIFGVEASHGTKHEYLKETAAPVVGFRGINEGREVDKSDDTLVTINLKILDASFEVDHAWAKGHMKGPEYALRKEGMRHLRQAFFGAEQQFIYGTAAGAAAGFTGMADVLDDSDDPMVVNAGGTSAGTGSSVWLIRMGENDLSAVLGQNANIEIGESVVQQLTDGDGKKYTGYWTPIEGWIGLQTGSAYSFARICNLTKDSGKGLTDDLLYDALEMFPSARQPNLILCNRRSLGQLRKSRTATNDTGKPAPRPTDIEGIPIVSTDSILNTETLLTAA